MSQPSNIVDMLVGTVVSIDGKYVDCDTDSGAMFIAFLKDIEGCNPEDLKPGMKVAVLRENVVLQDVELDSGR